MNKKTTFRFLLIAGLFFITNTSNAEEITTSTTSTIPVIEELPVISTPSNFSTLRGIITSSSGEPIPGTGVSIVNAEGLRYFSPTSNDGGFFFSAPEGDYKVEVILPTERLGLIKPLPYFTTLIAGEIRILPITIDHSESVEKSVFGKIVCKDGKPVSGAIVNAYNRQTGQWVTTESNESGNYKLNLAIGTWMVTLAPDQNGDEKWSWNGTPSEIVFGANERNDVRKINFNVDEALSYVNLKLLKENLEPISGVSVSIEKFGLKFPKNDQKIERPDFLGSASFKLTSGKYLIRAFSSNPEIILPRELIIEVKKGKTTDLQLIFKEKRNSPVSLTGNIKLENGSPAKNAVVWCWSDLGVLRRTTTDQNGDYSFGFLQNGRWHLSATFSSDGNKEYGTNNSQFILINNNYVMNLVLSEAEDVSYQKSVWQKTEQPMVLRSISGASVYLPSSAVSTSTATSSIYLSIGSAPDVRSKNQIRFIGSPYEINAVFENGKSIEKFEKEIEITLPYSDVSTKKLGVSEDEIVPGYFDKESGIWVKASNFMLNKDKKVVVLKTNHLSIFSLLTSPDTTPPLPVEKITATVREPGTVTLNWTNPKSDFSFTKVYRSEKHSTLGELIAGEVTTGAFTDSNLPKKTFYYTIKAVDANSNESKGKIITVNSGKINVPTKIAAGQKLGSSGEMTRLIQKALLKAGDLKADFEINGVFDKITLEAVNTFQKKNKLPLTNNVGPKTAVALNKFLK